MAAESAPRSLLRIEKKLDNEENESAAVHFGMLVISFCFTTVCISITFMTKCFSLTYFLEILT